MINFRCINAARFDGDEMNMHQPQNVLAETELRHLAATTYNLVSPSINAPIIGIYQDSLLGSYRFTRPGVTFTPREAMNLLMMFNKVNVDAIRAAGPKLTSFDVLSQILAPITLKYKTSLFDEDVDDVKTSNNVLEIRAGKYIRGQMDKGCLGSTTKGLIHRVCNDYGNVQAADFIDNLQNIITEYMKTSSFSVGISDLVANKETQDKIVQVIAGQKQEVQGVIDKVHLGIFENNTSNTNMMHFESTVNNILNEATNQAGKIGRKSLSKTNRFVMIVNSGSKGSPINISQMLSCLGQQNVDGKRIPYGFDSRTLPHFSKFDDSPAARGFIENSYISGLTAPELFFHAMGGRIGLIDTACKSVTWETPIVILENNKPKYIEIGKWIDDQLDTKDAKVQHFDERNMELLDTKGIFIPTTDEDGHVSWGEVTAITRHDPGNVLYEIKTSGGRSVIVTESKSLLIWNPETRKLKEMLTPDIKVGDCVPVTGDLCEPPVVLKSMNLNGSTFVLDHKNGILMGTAMAGGETDKTQNKNMFDILQNTTELPSEAFVASKEFVIGFLYGYVASQGALSDDGILITCVSTRFAEGINMLLSRLGIFGSMRNIGVIVQGKWANQLFRLIPFPCQANMDWNTAEFDTYNDVVLDKIVEINLVDVKDHPKMYDLTIPSTLNFGLANGLQVRDTSQTGYIQRRLIKGLEDLKVEYDMTVRNNKNKIVQFAYGDDGFDSVRAENQTIPLTGMSIEDIYIHYDIVGVNDQKSELMDVYAKGTATRVGKQATDAKIRCQKYIDKMIDAQRGVVESVFRNKTDNSVKLPVAFQNIIANIQGQLNLNSNSIVDITPLETFDLIEEYFQKLNQIHYAKPTPLFEVVYYFYLTPRDLVVNKRFHRKAIVLLLETVVLKYKQAIIHPGEMVGVVAGQSTGEPTTQLTLNSVTYETEILVRDSKGEIRCVQIGDFTRDQTALSQKVEYMEDKDTTYAELAEFYDVPSANTKGETVWCRIEAVTRHPVVNLDGTDMMLKVTTKGNRTVTATKAKSFLQLIDGEIKEIDGADLKVGDWLPVSKKPLVFTEQTHLDLRAILPPTEYVYGSELEKARSVYKEHQWWVKHAGKTFVLPHSRSDSVVRLLSDVIKPGSNVKTSANIKTNCVYMKLTNRCDYAIPEKIEMDYDFGYLVGAYAAEGCMTKHQISIANNDNDYLVPIKRWCDKHNITTKVYTHKDKIKEGWMSQDIRIYNTILCRILANLCGKLSHNKYVADKIMFSNRECILGFMDAYIGGDGCVHHTKRLDGSMRTTSISITSVSHKLLTSVQVMLKNLGILSKMHKMKKIEFNNRGTFPENIHQSYNLVVSNRQSSKLAAILNMSPKEKQAKAQRLLNEKFKYEYCAADLRVPNKINGEVVWMDRGDMCPDIEFDQIVSIEEVANTTKYAYDLTVETTRNFDCMNGLALSDTFHNAGVASKSNVTRGVPRIEEILRLTKNPKNPSLTVHLKPLDEADRDKATKYANMLEHTKLVNLVKSVQICFDPNDKATTIPEDKLLLEQYYEFERMMEECMETTMDSTIQKSKWIIRIELDAEALLDKNITTDDIHFAISNSHGNDISCVYSDYNSKNLVFRIRLNGSILNKSKKQRGIAETLDQSDDIYMLRNFQENLLNNIVLRGVPGIRNVIPRKLQNMVVKDEGKYSQKDVWVLDTTGTNMMDVLAFDFIDSTRTYSNDIQEIFDVLGIEAARQTIYNEMYEVMEFSGVYINYHHLSLLCDRMTLTKKMVSIFRSGILNDDIGPISKSTFEVHTEVLLDASRHADFDSMRGVSANVMMGQMGIFGTGAFQVVLDMDMIKNQEDQEVDMRKDQSEIDKMFGQFEDRTDICSKNHVEIRNNLSAVKPVDMGDCDDDYDIGF